MRIVKATREDWKWPAIFLLLGLAGALVSVRYFHQAFPEATIDLKLTRGEIGERATAWMRVRGLNPDRFRENIVFSPNNTTKTYLERELPQDEANRLMSSDDLSVWQWKVRRFNLPQKEEIVVRMSPAGRLVGFQHVIDETAPGERLNEAEAQRLAEIFMFSQTGVRLDDYALVQDELEARPNRNDYTFTWERKNYRVKDATLRLTVKMQGAEVGEFSQSLKIPEQWTRDYQRTRSRNDLLTFIATAFYLPLIIAAIIILVQRARKKQVAWKAFAGIGAFVGVLMAAMLLNSLPLVMAGAPTNASYSTYLVMLVILFLLLGLCAGLAIAVGAAAGDPLYTEAVPSRLPLARVFTFTGLRSREFFFSTLIGYGMAALHIGGTVLFYIIARRFGAWAPLEINYDNSISTAAPWLFPLATSIWAATSEEFSFRLFAIPLLQKWLRSKWLAIIIPAFIWGFLHSNYPPQPAWIRGVEVGLIGILAGWVMLRFGIIATLVWHYTVDAVLIGLFLIRSGQLFYRISGVLVADAVIIPLVVGVVLYFQNGGFVEEDEKDRTTEVFVAPVPEPVAAAADVTAAYTPIRSRRFRAGLVLGAAGLLVLGLVKAPALGDFVRVTAGRGQAEAVARQELEKRGVNVRGYRVATYSVASSGVAAEYLRRKAGVEGANRIYASSHVRVAEWETRFFRPLQKEEYRVRVAPDGAAPRVTYVQDEKAPGASLALNEAQTRAEQFLRQRGAPVDAYNLIESNLEQRPARKDYTFIWEARRPLAGDARERIQVQLIGDVVSGPQYSIKLPEAFERDLTRPRATQFATIVMFPLLACVVLVLFVKRIGQGRIRARAYVLFGITAALGLFFLGVLNSPEWANSYNTSIPWDNAMSQRALIMVLGAMGSLVAGFVALVADTLLQPDYGLVPLLPSRSEGRGAFLRDALICGSLAAFAFGGITHLVGAFVERVALPRPMTPFNVLEGASTLSLAGSAIAHTAMVTAWLVPLIGICAALALCWLRKPALIALAIIAVSAIMALAGAITPLGFLLTFAVMIARFGAAGLLVWLLGRNAAGYIVAIGWIAARPQLGQLLHHPAFRTDGIIFAGVLLAAVIALALWARSESQRDSDVERRAATSATV